ncbi:hotdog fold thioesterase [Candidatus Entotheonella palauensis]|uniref:hotdog fold thioesterase n=1 Tax=Candidatus Entotheonella palauensis TaxID=93172 RepID=UPI000B7E8726|nr:hotdog fold thioesterase [Candidatus Entotheonella palauensis]
MSIEQAEARFSRDPFSRFLGMNLVDIGHEHAIVALPYQPEHANAIGPLNGGASASLLNAAGKVAAWTGIDLDQKPNLACVDMTVQYLSAAIEEDVIAEAQVLRRGRDLFFLDVALRSPGGRPICQGLLSYRSPDYAGHTPRLLPRHIRHPEIAHTVSPDDAWLIRGYVEKLAITCQHYSPGRVQMHMPGIETLMDARGQLHDGALASVIDVCGTAAAWSLVPNRDGARGSTIGMQISYTQAAAEAVIADAHVRQRSEEIFFSTVYATTVTSGQLVAMGQVSYRLVEPR